MLEPNSPLAKAISDLFTITHLVGLGVFLLVTGLVLYAIVRFRAKPGQADPPPVYGHTRLEIAWTVGPALLLVVLFTLMLDTMARSDPNPQPSYRVAEVAANGAPAKPDLIIIGHQWWWEIRYPAAVITTANEIHLPTGRPLLLQLESADVVHDLWVPRLGRKMDLNPGFVQYLTWQADAPGTFFGACAEFCGAEHAWMLVRVIAQTPADFDAWVKSQQQPAAVPAAGSAAARGAQLFTQRTCISCHALNGTTAQALAGPNLTHIGSRETIGAGVLDHTPDNMRKWIQNPQAVKPGIYMPAVQLTDDELSDLVAYMESLK
jgi:cytochrome c oxidase subunit 2